MRSPAKPCASFSGMLRALRLRLRARGTSGNRHIAIQRRAGITAIDVIDRILDKGIVIDYEARISMLGVDLCTTVEARVVMASIDTFIRYAPALRRTGRILDRLSEMGSED